MIILLFVIILTLFHSFIHYVQGRLFLFQIYTSIVWAIISYFFIKIFDDRINSLAFKLGFINKKSKKWKIYCLCYVLIIYFIFILYLTSMDSDILISPIYLHNYFLKCKFDHLLCYFSLLKIHNTLSNVLVIPLISFGSSYIYTKLNSKWYQTGVSKKIVRGIIVYLLMRIIL